MLGPTELGMAGRPARSRLRLRLGTLLSRLAAETGAVDG